MHDVLAHSLTTFSLQTQAVRQVVTRHPDQAARMYLHAIQKDPKGVYAIIAANKRKPEYKTSRAEMKRIRVSPNPKRRTVPARAKTKASGSRSSRAH